MKSLPPLVTKPRHWLLGPIYYAQRDPLRQFPKWIEEYGDLPRIKGAIGEAVILGAPEMAQQVLVDRYSKYQKKSRSYIVLRILMGNGLVTSEGEFWRGQRKLVQPAFHRKRLDAIFSMMVERVDDLVARLGEVASAQKAVDLTPHLSHLTLDIISRAMFSSDVQGAAADVSKHIHVLNEYALRMLRNPWLFLLPKRIPLPFTSGPVGSLNAMNRIVNGIIQSRRKQSADERDDLLSMLISATEEETGRGMTDEQLRDEVMTIFVAGHETTANAMAWLLYLVSKHPEVEEKLVAEIEAKFPAEGLNSTNIHNFTYVREVIEESLRVYPSIWSIGRLCTTEDELGDYRIPVGMNMVVPIFYYHWSERFWKEPHKFDPSRFSPERRPAAQPMIYFPFGAGPRSCIGNHFAMQELMIMTILFHREFRFRVEAGFCVEPDPLITLRPKHGMKMHLSRRL
jgi:cytochrome P450